MSTRSNIIVARTDGTFARIYCHWDGYPTGVGAVLLAHYATQERAEALVALGAISSLDARCDGALGHSFDHPVKGQTVFYGRDRGEQDVAAEVGPTLASVWPGTETWTEYAYLWRNGAWSVGNPKTAKPGRFQSLASLLAKGGRD